MRQRHRGARRPISRCWLTPGAADWTWRRIGAGLALGRGAGSSTCWQKRCVHGGTCTALHCTMDAFHMPSSPYLHQQTSIVVVHISESTHVQQHEALLLIRINRSPEHRHCHGVLFAHTVVVGNTPRCKSATSCRVVSCRVCLLLVQPSPAADSAGDSISHHETTPAWHQMLWPLLCHKGIIIIIIIMTLSLSLSRPFQPTSVRRESQREPHPNCGQELDGKGAPFSCCHRQQQRLGLPIRGPPSAKTKEIDSYVRLFVVVFGCAVLAPPPPKLTSSGAAALVGLVHDKHLAQRNRRAAAAGTPPKRAQGWRCLAAPRVAG